jgi:hypothetical protein
LLSEFRFTNKEETMSEMQVSAGPADIGEMGPRPFAEIPGLWLKVTLMSQEFFSREAPRTSGSNTLIGVLIYGAASAVILAVLGMPAGGAPSRGATVTANGQIALLPSILLGLVAVPLGFYVGYGLQYLAARILGGPGSFGPQAYLTSLFIVPLGTLMNLVQFIPYAGPILLLVVGIYSFVLNGRVLMVVHRFTSSRAVAAMLLPVLAVGLVCCVGLLMLGPLVNNVFSTVILNVPTPTR